jgi:hypothetical protein
MAPGYVLAIGFELAGAVGLVLGLVLIRAEHRAKAMGLKTFLTSGTLPHRTTKASVAMNFRSSIRSLMASSEHSVPGGPVVGPRPVRDA